MTVAAEPRETTAPAHAPRAAASLRRFLLPRPDGARYRQLTLALGENGDISLTDHEMGAGLEAAWGADDNEVSLTIPAAAAAQLAFALLAERLEGRADASALLAALCEQYGVDHAVACWT